MMDKARQRSIVLAVHLLAVSIRPFGSQLWPETKTTKLLTKNFTMSIQLPRRPLGGLYCTSLAKNSQLNPHGGLTLLFSSLRRCPCRRLLTRYQLAKFAGLLGESLKSVPHAQNEVEDSNNVRNCDCFGGFRTVVTECDIHVFGLVPPNFSCLQPIRDRISKLIFSQCGDRMRLAALQR